MLHTGLSCLPRACVHVRACVRGWLGACVCTLLLELIVLPAAWSPLQIAAVAFGDIQADLEIEFYEDGTKMYGATDCWGERLGAMNATWVRQAQAAGTCSDGACS